MSPDEYPMAPDECPSTLLGSDGERYVQVSDLNRRSFLQHVSVFFALTSCGLVPSYASAVPDDGIFQLTRMSDVLERLGGEPADDDGISITTPDLAENGASVPVSLASSLAGVEDMYVLVESNPFPLAAAFSIPRGTDARMTVNLKLAQSSEVIGVVRTRDKLYWASKSTQVTVGGCT